MTSDQADGLGKALGLILAALILGWSFRSELRALAHLPETEAEVHEIREHLIAAPRGGFDPDRFIREYRGPKLPPEQAAALDKVLKTPGATPADVDRFFDGK